MPRARGLIDISAPVGAATPAWPGDTPFSFRWTWSMKEGSSCNVSAVTTSPHVGTHADAPQHFDPSGPGIGEMDLERYCGPCWVVAGPDTGLVEPDHLQTVDVAARPRILIRTRAQAPRAGDPFPPDFVALSPAAGEWLAASGALLVGLDTPSMDPFDSKELPAHHVLARHRLAILENLVLAHVEPGPYELIALPLRWPGLDASPVRAVLRPLA